MQITIGKYEIEIEPSTNYGTVCQRIVEALAETDATLGNVPFDLLKETAERLADVETVKRMRELEEK